MTTEATRERRIDADADDHRRFIARIDKTIIALLCERMRLGERLDSLEEHGAKVQEDVNDRDR